MEDRIAALKQSITKAMLANGDRAAVTNDGSTISIGANVWSGDDARRAFNDLRDDRLVVADDGAAWRLTRAGRKFAQLAKDTLEVVLVIDASGSMGWAQASTVKALNEQIDKLRGNEQVQTNLSLLFFSSGERTLAGKALPSVRTIIEGQPVDTVNALTVADYRIGGGTPLRDAMGAAIQLVDRRVKDWGSTAALVITLSDGEENTSTEYSDDSLAELVKAKQKTERWTFPCLGPQGLMPAFAERLGIPSGNVMTFDVMTEKGHHTAHVLYAMGTTNFRNAYGVLGSTGPRGAQGALGVTATASFFAGAEGANGATNDEQPRAVTVTAP